jgi:hypothetical protein
MDHKLQVVTRPVSDLNKGKVFYKTERTGFTLDVYHGPAADFRVVQSSPPGSACPVQLGIGLTDAPRAATRAGTTPPLVSQPAGADAAGHSGDWRVPSPVTGRPARHSSATW